MARNEEKAQSMLNRWLAYKRNEVGPGGRITTGKRPGFAGSVNTVSECEKWRLQIVKEVGRKMIDIQNESLGEQRIRDLNDEINKLLREKGHWERRILELGGPNYRKFERMADDALIAELEPRPGGDERGYTYKYFGAARNLPGVKDLFEKKSQERSARKRRFDYSIVNSEYYGLNEEEEEELLKQEQEAERKEVEAALKSWKKQAHETDKDNGIGSKKSLKSSLNESSMISVDAVLMHHPTLFKERIEKLLQEHRSSANQ